MQRNNRDYNNVMQTITRFTVCNVHLTMTVGLQGCHMNHNTGAVKLTSMTLTTSCRSGSTIQQCYGYKRKLGLYINTHMLIPNLDIKCKI
jgi:hypothetical protein